MFSFMKYLAEFKSLFIIYLVAAILKRKWEDGGGGRVEKMEYI